MRRILAIVVGIGLVGCSAPVEVSVPEPVAGTTESCRSLLAALPTELAASPARETLDERTAAWGDPPITLRCGIPKPEGLTAAAQCIEIDQVGWWEQPGTGGTVWTTIGREFFVEVAIPSEYGNPSAQLVDLAAAINQHNRVITRCQ